MTPGRASQQRKGLVDGHFESCREDAFRLLDHDARIQRGLELCAAAGEDARELDEALHSDPCLFRGSRWESDSDEAFARRHIGSAIGAWFGLRATCRRVLGLGPHRGRD